MPEDSKKTQHNKSKHDPNPKEQRKSRRQNQKTSDEKKANNEEPGRNAVPKPTNVSVEPGPDFYKNLKRETDEILKITEEANSSKFKKKEIQSNWAKYELPVETYEEIDQLESLGADYERLVQTPMSIGGHFQFKHEKSWDIITEPSLYDKYFETNMDDLATALSTIPFYKRNGIDLSVFSDTDKLSMESRATKYKRKYYNDKSFTNAELEAYEKIVSKELKGPRKSEANISQETEDIDLGVKNVCQAEDVTSKKNTDSSQTDKEIIGNRSNTSIYQAEVTKEEQEKSREGQNQHDVSSDDARIISNPIQSAVKTPTIADVHSKNDDLAAAGGTSIGAANPKPAIESPEDLEKWLNEFLDG